MNHFWVFFSSLSLCALSLCCCAVYGLKQTINFLKHTIQNSKVPCVCKCDIVKAEYFRYSHSDLSSLF